MGAHIRVGLLCLCAVLLVGNEARAGKNLLEDLFENVKEELKKAMEGSDSDQTRPKANPQRVISSQEDLRYVLQTIGLSLEHNAYGVKATWDNPGNGHSGEVVPTASDGTKAGLPCKAYRRTSNTSNSITRYQGSACRERNRMWTVTSEEVLSMAVTQTSPDSSSRPPKAPSPSGVSASKTTAPGSRAYPDRGTVREVQSRLTHLGYSPGPIDGVYGRKTRQAVEAFQRDGGLVQDGKVTSALLSQLRTQAEQSVGVARSEKKAIPELDEIGDGVRQSADTPFPLGSTTTPAGKAPTSVTLATSNEPAFILEQSSLTKESPIAGSPYPRALETAAYADRAVRRESFDILAEAVRERVYYDIRQIAEAFWSSRNQSIVPHEQLAHDVLRGSSRAKQFPDVDGSETTFGQTDSFLTLLAMLVFQNRAGVTPEDMDALPVSVDVDRLQLLPEVAALYEDHDDYTATVTVYLLGIADVKSPVEFDIVSPSATTKNGSESADIVSLLDVMDQRLQQLAESETVAQTLGLPSLLGGLLHASESMTPAGKEEGIEGATPGGFEEPDHHGLDVAEKWRASRSHLFEVVRPYGSMLQTIAVSGAEADEPAGTIRERILGSAGQVLIETTHKLRSEPPFAGPTVNQKFDVDITFLQAAHPYELLLLLIHDVRTLWKVVADIEKSSIGETSSTRVAALTPPPRSTEKVKAQKSEYSAFEDKGVSSQASAQTKVSANKAKLVLIDGTEIVVKRLDGFIKVKSLLGMIEIPATEIQSLKDGHFQLSDGTVLKGEIAGGEVNASSRFGDQSFPATSIAAIVLPRAETDK